MTPIEQLEQGTSRDGIRDLESQGVSFQRFTTPDRSLSVLHPHPWTATWKESHLSLCHGNPPEGWLTVYPVPLNAAVSSADLLDHFLDEFVVPDTGDIHTISFAPLPSAPELEAVEFEFARGETNYHGLALGWTGHRQGRVASYWIAGEMFQRNLVQALLVAVLGSVETPKGSIFEDRPPLDIPITEEEIWLESPFETPISFGAADGRFALRMPPGWEGLEVSYDGDIGWLLRPSPVLPDDSSPEPTGVDALAPPLISVSGADLMAPLSEMIQKGLQSVGHEGGYALELGPIEVEVAEQKGSVQVWRGIPQDGSGDVHRIWSLGLTDGESVVHLLAVARADRMVSLLPALNAIGRSIRVLPRALNLELTSQMVGHWRYLDALEDSEEVIERCFRLRGDGSFSSSQNTIKRAEALDHRPSNAAISLNSGHGRWDIVGRTLSLAPTDGFRKSFEIDGVSEKYAIVGKVFWEKLMP